MLKQRIITFINSGFVKFSLKSFRNPRGINYLGDYRYAAGEMTNPYKPQFEMTEEERVENDKLPLEERVLDWRKYMKHKGKLKYSTGVFLTDVEPFPRLKIMMICDIALTYIKQMPDSFDYKHYIFQYFKFIMKLVDQNESIIDIEAQVPNCNNAEEMIEMLHNEVIFLQYCIDNKVWDSLQEKDPNGFTDKEFFFMTAAFRENQPFPGATETTKHKKNERPTRPATAGFTEKAQEEKSKI
jgi:hypothetical protein